MINLEILGKFYDNHSLSLINRQLATHLNNCKDFNVFLTPLDSTYLSKSKYCFINEI